VIAEGRIQAEEEEPEIRHRFEEQDKAIDRLSHRTAGRRAEIRADETSSSYLEG